MSKIDQTPPDPNSSLTRPILRNRLSLEQKLAKKRKKIDADVNWQNIQRQKEAEDRNKDPEYIKQRRPHTATPIRNEPPADDIDDVIMAEPTHFLHQHHPIPVLYPLYTITPSNSSSHNDFTNTPYFSSISSINVFTHCLFRHAI